MISAHIGNNLVAVSHKVKSFQQTGFFATGSLSILMNPYFHTFNWHLQVLIKQKEIQHQCPHSKLFPGSGLV